MDYPFYILDIDDDDNLSGVDAVGLVEHPAIELGWMAFSKQNMESYTDYLILFNDGIKLCKRSDFKIL
jgi:hypothetical protein